MHVHVQVQVRAVCRGASQAECVPVRPGTDQQAGPIVQMILVLRMAFYGRRRWGSGEAEGGVSWVE